MAEPFAAALALGGGWREAADTLGSGLAGAKGRLGLLYTAESFAPHQGGKPALPGKALRETWLDSEGGPASRALGACAAEPFRKMLVETNPDR